MRIINILIDAISKFILKIYSYRNDPIRIAKILGIRELKLERMPIFIHGV